MAEQDRTATVVAEVRWLLSDAKVYRLSEPVEWRDWDGSVLGTTDHVIVSAVAFTPLGPGGPEAMAWASDADGNFLAGEDDRGMPLAQVREYRHDAAVEDLGFRVVPGDESPRRLPSPCGSDESPTREEMEAFNRELAISIKSSLASLERLCEELDRVMEEADRD